MQGRNLVCEAAPTLLAVLCQICIAYYGTVTYMNYIVLLCIETRVRKQTQ